MNLLALAIIGVLVLIFLSAVLSPLESLVWWAGWERDEDPLSPGPHGLHGNDGALRDDEGPAPAQSTHYIVYLSGIGALSGTSIPAEEVPFIQELQARLPHTRIVDDVFPYSVANRGLTGEHALAWFWQKLEQSRINNAGSLAALLINLRNAWQVLVSADPRYGPYMNLGVAQEIGSALLRCGYEPGSGTPVTLIGWSGGGQIAVGAARYLWKLNAPCVSSRSAASSPTTPAWIKSSASGTSTGKKIICIASAVCSTWAAGLLCRNLTGIAALRRAKSPVSNSAPISTMAPATILICTPPARHLRLHLRRKNYHHDHRTIGSGGCANVTRCNVQGAKRLLHVA